MKNTLPILDSLRGNRRLRRGNRRLRRGNTVITILGLLVVAAGIGGAVYWTMFRNQPVAGDGPMVRQGSQGLMVE